MPRFKSFNSLERYLKIRFPKILRTSADIERVMAEAMSQAVYDVVYDYFEPESYERRKDAGGLSDVRNMGITSYGINENGEAFIIFENLTEGADNLQGQFTTDTIVYGISSNWQAPNGPWVDKRDFVGKTAEVLRDNPTKLLEAFKKALIENGLQVK